MEDSQAQSVGRYIQTQIRTDSYLNVFPEGHFVAHLSIDSLDTYTFASGRQGVGAFFTTHSGQDLSYVWSLGHLR